MTSRRVAFLVLAAALSAAPLAAQRVYLQRRTGGYGALGFGGGNFTLDCDSLCGNNKLSSAGGALFLGRHINPRLRIELGLMYQSNRDSASNVSTAQVGAAFYPVSNLYVRGGVAWHRTSVEQASGTYDGSGGPGYSVGAGFDMYLGRIFALTPYVNYSSGAISKLDVSGGAGVTTGGTMKTMNFGVMASWIRSTYICVTASGEHIRVEPKHRQAALACLAEVERRIGPQNIKRP